MELKTNEFDNTNGVIKESPIAGSDQTIAASSVRVQLPGGSLHGDRANFTRRVLGCMNVSDSKSRRIFSIMIFRNLPDLHSFAPLQT